MQTTLASTPALTRAFARTLSGILVAAVSLLFAGPQAVAQTQMPSGQGIAAIVNDDIISMLDLNSRISLVTASAELANSPETRSKIAPQVLQGLIDEKLKLQETRRERVKVSQDDIQKALQSIADKNRLTLEQLTAQLQGLGVPLAALGARVETELAWNFYLQRRLAQKILIGNEEVNDEINRIQANAGKPEYLLAEIFLPVASPAEDAAVRTVAERLLLQLKQGAPFSGLAKNFSRAPSAALEGDMGWVQGENLDPALLQALGNLNPGTASLPVRALGGYYILLLRKVRTSPGLGDADAAVTLSQYHVPVKKGTSPDAIEAIRSQLIATTRAWVGCGVLEAAGAKSGSLLSGSVGQMKLSNLPQDMQLALQNLAVGQPSMPIVTGGGFAVLMICERTDDTTNMDEVRDTIRTELIQSRLNVVAQRKLRDLRRDAFIDIRL